MAKRFTHLETRKVRGRFWRGLPQKFKETALESGPNFRNNTRYAVPSEFSALYFSGALEHAQKEVSNKSDDEGEMFVFLQFDITVDGIVDLSDPDIQKQLSVSLEDIVKPKHIPGAYMETQRIAKEVFSNRLNGILAPSTYNPYNKENCNLVLFPGNLVRALIKEL